MKERENKREREEEMKSKIIVMKVIQGEEEMTCVIKVTTLTETHL